MKRILVALALVAATGFAYAQDEDRPYVQDDLTYTQEENQPYVGREVQPYAQDEDQTYSQDEDQTYVQDEDQPVQGGAQTYAADEDRPDVGGEVQTYAQDESQTLEPIIVEGSDVGRIILDCEPPNGAPECATFHELLRQNFTPREIGMLFGGSSAYFEYPVSYDRTRERYLAFLQNLQENGMPAPVSNQ